MHNLWARFHLALGKLTRLVFYASLVLLGWYFISNAKIISTSAEDIGLGQIFSVLLGAGILIITLIAFFDFPEEANPLAEFSIYRSVWGNLGILLIIIAALIYWWLSFNDHFDEPFWQRVILLFKDIYSRITFELNKIFK